jgi:O-acetylhomoserine/O-acetylserine sulfhydrylase-like pyridoxal-dependent enzyme
MVYAIVWPFRAAIRVDEKPHSDRPPGFSTRAIHQGHDPASHHGSLNPPVYLNATNSFDSIAQGQQRFPGEVPGLNPAQLVLGKRLASLEGGARGGTGSGIGHRPGVCAGVRFMDALQLAQRALSLGNAKTLVQHSCHHDP